MSKPVYTVSFSAATGKWIVSEKIDNVTSTYNQYSNEDDANNEAAALTQCAQYDEDQDIYANFG